MRTQRKRTVLTREEIDRTVVAQANDESEWEPPIRVSRLGPTSVELPAHLAARAAFFARVHGGADLNEWVQRVVEDRGDVEEAAFVSVKRDLAANLAS